MATQLWLLRHGEAVPHDDADDDGRPLTDRGRLQSVAAGRALARLEVPVHDCFTSPKLRAKETAELACRELGLEPVVHPPLSSGFAARDALELLDADRIVLIAGHDPDLSQVVHDLTGAHVKLKKGGVAGVRMAGGSGELLVLLRPRELARIAGAV